MKETKILSSEDMCANMIEELQREGWVYQKAEAVKKEIIEVQHVFVREVDEKV